MTTLAANAVLTAHRAALAVAGEAVQYRRGVDVIELDALPARAQFVEDGGEEFSHSSREKDWIVAVEDLFVLSTPFVPARGDRVLWTSPDGVERQYEVLPREDGRHYRHCDPTLMKLRIYTVETTATADP